MFFKLCTKSFHLKQLEQSCQPKICISIYHFGMFSTEVLNFEASSSTLEEMPPFSKTLWYKPLQKSWIYFLIYYFLHNLVLSLYRKTCFSQIQSYGVLGCQIESSLKVSNSVVEILQTSIDQQVLDNSKTQTVDDNLSASQELFPRNFSQVLRARLSPVNLQIVSRALFVATIATDSTFTESQVFRNLNTISPNPEP